MRLKPFIVTLLILVISAAPVSLASGSPTDQSLVESTSHIIKLTDKGLVPSTLHTRLVDKIVFFVNDTKESLTTMRIDFGKKITHCASTNLKIGEDGVISSVKPFAPRDFATICVHETGQYAFSVYGVGNNEKGMQGKIIVEP